MNEIQASLFDGSPLHPLVQPEYGREETIQQRFERFHAMNPFVYDSLRALALQMVRAGVKKYGVKGLFETLRWHYTLSTQGEPFKLSNDLTSRYARLLMEREPALEGFFELRELRSE